MAQPLRNVHALSPTRTIAAPRTLQDFKQGWWSRFIHRHFVFPKGEFAIVTENGNKISLPTPLLGALIALFVWLAGGTLAGVWLVASMSANVSNLSDSMLRYQISDQAEKKTERDRTEGELKSLKEKLELTELKLADLREKQIRAEARRQ